MNIAVVGNCQSLSFAASLRALLPTASVERFHVGRVSPDQLRTAARTCDIFYAQRQVSKKLDGLAAEHIRYFPIIVFTGFHPDITWLRSESGLIRSPAGQLHSALIAACYLRGIPANRVPSLFNTYIFAELGYLGEFERASENLASTGEECGLDLRSLIPCWLKEGSFMHTVNHPKMRVLFSIVTALLKKEGLPISDQTEPLADRLSRAVQWPLHQTLADKIGIPADPEFRSREQKPQRLPEFAVRSYAIYDSLPKATLLNNTAIARAVDDLERAGVR